MTDYRTLRYFQDPYFIKSKYEVGGQTLSNPKAREICSNVAHGTSYLHAWDTANGLIKPVLFFYGMSSLSRALVLFLRRSAREASLKPQHGLSATGWRTHISKGGTAVVDIEATITRGLFFDLYCTTKNIEIGRRSGAPAEKALWQYSLGSPEPEQLLGQRFSFREVLQRTVGLQEEIKHSFGIESLLFPGSDLGARTGYPNTLILDLQANEDSFRAYFGNSTHLSEVRPYGTPSVWLMLPEDNVGAYIEHIPKKLALRDMKKYAPRMEAGVTLSTLMCCFSCAYFLGMLARYFPTFWAEGLTFSASTSGFPLFQNASEILLDVFIEKWIQAFDLHNDVRLSG